MFIDTQAVLKDVHGDNAQWPGKSKQLENLTLRTVIIEAVLGTYEHEKLNASEQHDRYLLAQLFFDNSGLPVQITQTQAQQIKDLISYCWKKHLLVSGQAIDMINNSPKNAELKAVN